MSDTADHRSLRCPTCAATQSPASECRRCKCDLSLYVAALDCRRRYRQLILQCLSDQRYDEALEAARHYAALAPDRDVARWIAVAHLLRSDFAAALAAGERAISPAASKRPTVMD